MRQMLRVYFIQKAEMNYLLDYIFPVTLAASTLYASILLYTRSTQLSKLLEESKRKKERTVDVSSPYRSPAWKDDEDEDEDEDEDDEDEEAYLDDDDEDVRDVGEFSFAIVRGRRLKCPACGVNTKYNVPKFCLEPCTKPHVAHLHQGCFDCKATWIVLPEEE